MLKTRHKNKNVKNQLLKKYLECGLGLGLVLALSFVLFNKTVLLFSRTKNVEGLRLWQLHFKGLQAYMSRL